MKVRDFVAANFLPSWVVVLGDLDACICVNTLSGHPVVCLRVTDPNGRPIPDLPPQIHPGENGMIAYDTAGNIVTDPFTDQWTGQQVTDELAGGFLGSIMDCVDQLDADVRDQLYESLGVADNAELVAKIRELICPLLAALFNEECPDPGSDLPEWWEDAAALSEFCDDFRLDLWKELRDRCQAQPVEPIVEPLPEPEPIPGTPPPPPAPYRSKINCGGYGGCPLVEQYFDHPLTLEETIAWGQANCHCRA